MKKYILVFIILLIYISKGQDQTLTQPEGISSESNGGVEITEQTGDFNYSIPLLVVPGTNNFNFNLSLNYNSNISPNSEASWVGWGWNLNLGSITRIQNGLPDDYNEAEIEYYNKNPDYVEASIKIDASPEIASVRALSGNLNFNYSNIGGYYKTYGAAFNGPILPYIGGMSMSWTYNQTGDLLQNASFSGVLGILNSIALNNEAGRETIRKQSNLFDAVNFYVSGGGASYYNNRLKFNSTKILMPEFSTDMFSGRLSFRADLIPKIGVDVGVEANVTRTEYEESYTRKSVGFLYSNYANSVNKNLVMDYSIDRTNPFNYRDRFLPIPSGSPDEFVVSGPGLGGGFKYFFEDPLNLKPYSQRNETNQFSLGSGVNFGPFIFGGALNINKSLGNYTSIEPTKKSSDWNNGCFRFNNDPGLYKKVSTLNYSNNNVNLDGTPITNIKYHTIGDIRNNQNLNFNKKLNINSENVKNEISINSLIAEFEITNTSGIKYIYGLPVFNKDYEVISLGLPLEFKSKVLNNTYYPYDFYESKSKTKIGNKLLTPFSSSFLLTEMRSSNYIDIHNDGPTNDDIGDYISFDYIRTAASTSSSKDDNKIDLSNSYNSWSIWRIPFKGYDYKINRISDPYDDLISRSQGTKEIYYLNSIKTKTHIAFFVNNMSNSYVKKEFKINMNGQDIDILGSGGIRKDAWDNSISITSTDYNSSSSSYVNPHLYNNHNRVLEKIILFTLDTEKEKTKLVDDKTIYVKQKLKTINLKYDYSLRKGIPNSSLNILNESGDDGKLTLKKIWSEYQDVIEPEVTPFEFEYSYPTDVNVDYPIEYSHLDNYQSTVSGNLIENPDYNYFQTDRWGKYRLGDLTGTAAGDLNIGKNRAENLNQSVDQIPHTLFDPAAWRLKRIIQPTGGEVHIQYEQKDYSNVQNRETYTLAKIKSTEIIGNKRVYTLDLDEIFVESIPGPTKANIVDKINYYFSPTNANGLKKKIYGKFLFNMISDDAIDPIPNLSTSYSEYVDGFVRFESCILNTYNDIEITLVGDPFREMCIRDYKTYSHGLVPSTGDYKDYKNLDHINSNVDLVGKILSNIGKYNWAFENNYCFVINKDLSYLRIPLLSDKIGGGARVKRILYYDKFNKEIELDESSLYGVEYSYINEDGRSSGVASTEPELGKEENSLIEILDYRFDQTYSDKSVNGKDTDQFYSPLGDNLLESPSIVYSRVIQKSINIFDSDYSITNNGFTVNKYYTTKDFPYDNIFINQANQPINSFSFTKLNKEESQIPWLPNPVNAVDVSTFSGEQDYFLIKSRFNGVLRESSTYSGELNNKSTWRLRSFKKNNYLMPGESVPLFKGFNYNSSLGSPLTFECGIPGLDIESYEESKLAFETKKFINASADLDAIFTPLPTPAPTIWPKLTIIERKLQTNVSTTLYTFPLILKSVETYNDGSYNKVENIAFDHKTGSPVITKSNDEFDDLTLKGQSHTGNYYNYNFPASYKYSDFNKLSIIKELERASLYFSINGATASLVYGTLSMPLDHYFQAGDKLKIITIPNSGYFFAEVQDAVSNEILIDKTVVESSSFYKIEILDSKLSNIPKIASDNITTYGGVDVINYCGTDVPNEFTHINQLFVETFSNQMDDLKVDLNQQISLAISSGNYSPLNLDLSSTTLNSYDLINGFEPLSDTSKFQIIAVFDTTIDQQIPLDSIGVRIDYDNKNELKYNDRIPSTHLLVDNLNNTLNSLWGLKLNNILSNQFLFNNCNSNDSLNQFYNNYFIGELDSLQIDSVNSYSSLNNLYNDSYMIYNQDSLKHIFVKGENLMNQDSERSMFISFRDLDSNFNVGEKKLSYLSSYDDSFIKDTNNNKFKLSFTKYLQPDCNSLDSLQCFKQDCRDTILLEHEEIRNNWDTTFILLPGTENETNIINFPTNDSLFSFLKISQKFTDEFGYFSLDSIGFLTYNTISSINGYNSDTTYRIFRLLNVDTNETFEHINSQAFILNPLINPDVFIIDTNNNFQLALSDNLIPIGENTVFGTYISTTISKLPYYVNFKANNVIKAVSQTFKTPDINENQIPEKKVFADKTYLYRKNRMYTNTESYASAGVINDFITYYHNTNNVNNQNWFQVNQNTQVDEVGKIHESLDLKNIKSTIVYDINERPKVVATNAAYRDIYFNDFELPDWGRYIVINGAYIANNNFSHTGSTSLMIESNSPSASLRSFFAINNINLSESILNQGLIIKFWAKIDNTNGCISEFEDAAISIDYKFNGGFPSTFSSVIPITKSGEWYLYEVVLPNSFFSGHSISDNISFQIRNSLTSCHQTDRVNIYLDDILIKPLNSLSESFIYDYKSNRITATLDNNHFAGIIQYNEKGQPVRNIVETYQGRKTVSESQFNTPKVERSDPEPNPIPLIENKKSTNSNLRIGASEILQFKKNTPKDQQVNAKFNLLDVKISQDSSNIKFFKIDKDLKLDSMDSYVPKIDDNLNGVNKIINIDSLKNEQNLNKIKDKYSNTIDSLDVEISNKRKKINGSNENDNYNGAKK